MRTPKIIGLLLLTLFLWGCQGLPVEKGQEVLPLDPAVHTGTLENGLTWYVKENSEPENRISLRLLVNAGSLQERDNQQGLAHFVEHMCFNGTENFAKMEIVDYLESIGMAFGPEINAYTGFDQTVYMLEVPADDPDTVETALRILEEWAHRVRFAPEEIEKERGVIREEWRLGRGARGRIQDALLPVLFEGSRYARRLPIGKMDIVMTAPREELTDFYNTWYRPDLMAVTAVGDFDAEALIAGIEEHFSFPGPEKSPAPFREEVPLNDETKTLVIKDPEVPVTSVELSIKKPAPLYRSRQDYRRMLTQQLFWQMFNTRLAALSRQSDPPFISAYGGFQNFIRTTGLVSLSAAVQAGKAENALTAFGREIARIQQHGFRGEELKRAKAESLRFIEKAYRERENQSSAQLSAELAEYYLNGIFMPGIDAEHRLYNELVPEISAADIAEYVRRTFNRKGEMITLIQPEENPAPAQGALLAAYEGALAETLEAEEQEALNSDILSQIPSPGNIVKEAEGPEGSLIWELSNGSRVILKQTDFREDQVLFNAYSPGGLSLVEDHDYYAALYAPLIAAESGLGPFSADQLKQLLAGRDLSLNPYLESQFEGIHGGFSPQDQELFFKLLRLTFTAPRFDSEMEENIKGRLAALVENRRKDPYNVYYDRLTEILSGGDYRAQPLDSQRLAEVTVEAAERIFKERFQDPSGFTFIFTGSFDESALRKDVKLYIASLHGTERLEEGQDRGIRPPARVVEETIERGEDPQGAVTLVYSGERNPYRYKERLLAQATALILETRLRERLREDLSGTYHVGASAATALHPYPGFEARINFGCDPARADELTAAVREEIEKLRTGVTESKYLIKARQQYRRHFEKEQKSNGFWLRYLRRYASAETPDGALLIGPEAYEGLITPEAIRETAQWLFPPDRHVTLTLLPVE